MARLTASQVSVSSGVDAGLLTQAERDWLNAYHAEGRARLRGRLSAEEFAWLEGYTRDV